MRPFHTLLALAALVTLVACPGGSIAVPTITSFTATPAGLPAGGGTTTLAWNVTGATSLTIDQGVGSVTGLSQKDVSVTTATTFTLTATNAAGSVSATAAVAVASTLTVSGKVVFQGLRPAAGVPVVITGHPATVTDADGNFSVAGVTTPYEAAAVWDPQMTVFVYQGLTRADPTLTLRLSRGQHAASIGGTLTGGAGFPEPADHVTKLTFTGADTRETSTNVNATTGTYLIDGTSLEWNGPTSISGTLRGLQYSHAAGDADMKPVSYTGYGIMGGVSVTDGVALTGQNFALAPVGTATMSASVSVPTGYTVLFKSVGLEADSRSAMAIFDDRSTDTSLIYKTPDISGTTLRLHVQASAPGGGISEAVRGGLAPDATSVSLGLLPAPASVLPASAATGVTTATSFSWTAFEGGVHALVIIGTSGLPTYWVFTEGTTATIPDLSALGLALPAAASYQWAVLGLAPFASVNAAAGPTGIRPPSATAYAGISATRSFTTAP